MSQLYTLDEVKIRNGKNGARTWIVIHDVVYDVTDYLNDVREDQTSTKINLKQTK